MIDNEFIMNVLFELDTCDDIHFPVALGVFNKCQIVLPRILLCLH